MALRELSRQAFQFAEVDDLELQLVAPVELVERCDGTPNDGEHPAAIWRSEQLANQGATHGAGSPDDDGTIARDRCLLQRLKAQKQRPARRIHEASPWCLPACLLPVG